jgi:hypothetical protein
MFEFVTKYKNQGHFFFKMNDDLLEVTKDVPDEPGVYYIFSLSRGNIDLVYVSRSGILKQNGTFKPPLLRAHINSKTEGMSAQDNFFRKMVEEDIEALDIYWFVTMDKDHYDLPGYVEGMIMQRYFEMYGTLPPWNKAY